MPYRNPEWLRQKYEVDGLSTYDIGRLVERDPKTIYDWLKKFGIDTRPRGLNLKGSDNFMSQPGVVNPFSGRHHSPETRRVLSRKASRPKPYLRGSRNGMAGRCGTSNPRYIDGSSPERQRRYASAEWKEILRQVYARDNYRCVRCQAPKQGRRSLHAHHLKPWAGNPHLRFDLSNLVTLCKLCHDWVHSRKNTERVYLG